MITLRRLSVHGPSEPKVAGQVSSVVPVGPKVEPRARIWLPKGVLDDAQVVRATFRLSVVERESDAVGHGSVLQACVQLFRSDVFLQVPAGNFVSCRVNRWNTRLAWRNCRLFVRVLSVSKLENFAYKNALRISGVRTCKSRSIVSTESNMSFSFRFDLPQKSVLKEDASETSAPPRTFEALYCVDFVAKLNIVD